MIRRYLAWLATQGVECPNKAEFVFRLGSYAARANAACTEPCDDPIAPDEVF